MKSAGDEDEQPSPAATQPEMRRPHGGRLEILDLQNQYLQQEGPTHRGVAFEKLLNGIRFLCVTKEKPPFTELEILELLGYPDYGASDGRGAELAYVCEGQVDYLIQIGPDGILRHVGSSSGNAAALTALPRWHRYSWTFHPAAGSGYLGIKLDPRELHTGDPSGILVAAIAPGSPASHSDLRPRDLIVAIDGAPVGLGGARTFFEQVAALKPGKAITLNVLRRGATGQQSTQTVKMTVGARKDD